MAFDFGSVSAQAIGYGHDTKNLWLWHDDPRTHDIRYSVQGSDSDCGELELASGIAPSPLFVSFDEAISLMKISEAPCFQPIPVYIRSDNFSRGQFGAVGSFKITVTVVYGMFAGRISSSNRINVIGVLSPTEAGPFQGSVTGATQFHDVKYDDGWSRWSFGVYNIGRQISGDKWSGDGDLATVSVYTSAIWNTPADVLIVEPRETTFLSDINLATNSIASGKIVILPAAAFHAFTDATSAAVSTMQQFGASYQYALHGRGAVINGSLDGNTAWSFDWVASTFLPGFSRYRPIEDYVDVAKALNHIIAELQNRPPHADAGSDQTIECVGPGGGQVALDATRSSDPDGDELTFTWKADGHVIATGETASVIRSLGVHAIELTVTDPAGESDTDEISVTVEDTLPPEIEVATDPIVLWPPSNKYHRIEVDEFVTDVTDQCAGAIDVSSVSIDVVTSDEPLEVSGISNDRGKDPSGYGTIANDIAIQDCGSIDLRAKRLGGGDGRVYRIHVAASDGNSNIGTASFPIHVPHNRKVPGAHAIEGPAASTVSAPPACVVGANGKAGVTMHPPVINDAVDAASSFNLEGNYPNPFNPRTTIRFSLREPAPVQLVVYDMLGRQVEVLIDGVLSGGVHDVRFDAETLVSGTYLYRLSTPDGDVTHTMNVLK